MEHIILDHPIKFLPALHTDFREAITRQIDQIPTIIHNKMVDKQRFTRRRRSLRQVLLASKFIDKGRFAYVRPANKREFGEAMFRTLTPIRITFDKNRFLDIHERTKLVRKKKSRKEEIDKASRRDKHH